MKTTFSTIPAPHIAARAIPILALALAAVAPGARAQQTLDRTFDVTDDPRVEVHNPFGDVTVETWNRREVRVRARHGRVRPRIDATRRSISLHPDGKPDEDHPIAYTLTVPSGADLEVHTVQGKIDVDGARGRLEANSVNGDVRVRGGRGVVDVNTVQGAVELSDAAGRIEVNSVNDRVTIRRVSGDLSVTTVNGAIGMQEIDSRAVEATTVNGGITFDGPLHADGWYELSTHNGEISLAIPEGTGARVEISTFNGHVEADFPVTLGSPEARRNVTFTIGDGGARLDLETFNGTIRLRRP